MSTSPDAATQTMINNLPEKTGKSLDQWITVLGKAKLEKHGEMVKLLKTDHGVGHGFANLITPLPRRTLGRSTRPSSNRCGVSAKRWSAIAFESKTKSKSTTN